MIVKFRKGAENVCPTEWFYFNLKCGNIKTESIVEYGKYYDFIEDWEYEIIFKDEEYVLVKTSSDIVLCGKVEDIIKEEIKIGDKVKVIHSGMIYSNYNDFFIENNDIDIYLITNYQYTRGDIDTSLKYKVRYIGKHSTNGSTICLIQEIKNEPKNGKVYLINMEGLEVDED